MTMSKEAITFMEASWTAHKIHPHGIPDIDIKICQEIRKSVILK